MVIVVACIADSLKLVWLSAVVWPFLTFALFLIVRPSVTLKDSRYFTFNLVRYFWRFVVAMALLLFVAGWYNLVLLQKITAVAPIMRPLFLAPGYLGLIPRALLSYIHPCSVLSLFLSPLTIFYFLFLCDNPHPLFGMFNAFLSALRAVIYNLPLCVIAFYLLAVGAYVLYRGSAVCVVCWYYRAECVAGYFFAVGGVGARCGCILNDDL